MLRVSWRKGHLKDILGVSTRLSCGWSRVALLTNDQVYVFMSGRNIGANDDTEATSHRNSKRSNGNQGKSNNHSNSETRNGVCRRRGTTHTISPCHNEPSKAKKPVWMNMVLGHEAVGRISRYRRDTTTARWAKTQKCRTTG